MQNSIGFIVGILLFSFAFIVLILIFVAIFVNFEEIQERVRGFFENRTARRVAKKLNIVDKGKIPSSYENETDKDGQSTQERYRTVHVHCGSTVRVAISNKRAVHWCHVCELVFPEDGDNGGGSGGRETPYEPVPPGLEGDVSGLLDRIRKGIIKNT